MTLGLPFVCFAGGALRRGTMDGFEQLTREHGVRVETLYGVEGCSLLVGEIVGHNHVVSASRMNKAVVLFLSSVEKACEVIQSGIVIRGSLTPVLPLAGPSRKVILSNVPPFLSDEHTKTPDVF